MNSLPLPAKVNITLSCLLLSSTKYMVTLYIALALFTLLITSVGHYYLDCHENKMAAPLDILHFYRLYLH